MSRLFLAFALTSAMAASPPAAAFGGVYAVRGKSDPPTAPSQIVVVRDGERTTVTVAIEVDPYDEESEFLFIVPVPDAVTSDQVMLREEGATRWVDTITAPVFQDVPDEDPCRSFPSVMSADGTTLTITSRMSTPWIVCSLPRGYGYREVDQADDQNYSWLLLSSIESKQIATRLAGRGYRLPAGALKQLAAHTSRGMKLLVVDLKESWRTENPQAIQFSYQSSSFSVPITLGAPAINDQVIHVIAREGRAKPANYNTVKLATDMTVPKMTAAALLKAILEHESEKHRDPIVFTEYTGEFENEDSVFLQRLGVSWDGPAFVTRLHLRAVPRKRFSDELLLRVDGSDRDAYSIRYRLRSSFGLSTDCGPEGEKYREDLPARESEASRALQEITGLIDASR